MLAHSVNHAGLQLMRLWVCDAMEKGTLGKGVTLASVSSSIYYRKTAADLRESEFGFVPLRWYWKICIICTPLLAVLALCLWGACVLTREKSASWLRGLAVSCALAIVMG